MGSCNVLGKKCLRPHVSQGSTQLSKNTTQWLQPVLKFYKKLVMFRGRNQYAKSLHDTATKVKCRYWWCCRHWMYLMTDFSKQTLQAGTPKGAVVFFFGNFSCDIDVTQVIWNVALCNVQNSRQKRCKTVCC